MVSLGEGGGGGSRVTSKILAMKSADGFANPATASGVFCTFLVLGFFFCSVFFWFVFWAKKHQHYVTSYIMFKDDSVQSSTRIPVFAPM